MTVSPSQGALQVSSMTKITSRPQTTQPSPAITQQILSPTRSYTNDLKNRLDDFESRQGLTSPSSMVPKRQSTRLDYPQHEKGTLHGQMTEYLANVEPVTVDFSSMPINSPQIQSVDWGELGLPATTGSQRPTDELMLLQQRQERLLSKSSSVYRSSPRSPMEPKKP
ncbi:MAG: hypothetical protein EZS28_049763 [Streblomastix strix]|uniref:Uncharacterized protein n=1 Tax=Streblomastix strix TaxID=222440 RepID=A0A5J4TAZ7_9EUKA|nr:MAG: hypothetical protein EZS28_049763 [Streblomastix strix]